MADISDLLTPGHVWSRSEVLARPCPIPNAPGVYAWYFAWPPPGVPTGGVHRHDGLALLYVGIAPKAPPRNGRAASTQTIRDRIRYHYRGNAEGSTLRLTLGCLLAEQLGIKLRRVGSGQRMTFGAGEDALSQWMGEHAFVCWTTVANPWEAEANLIHRLDLPLNLDQNRHGSFHADLTRCRRQAKARARQLPVLP